MGSCVSTSTPSDAIKIEKRGRGGKDGKFHNLNIHAATGLHPGDTPYPTKSSTGSRQGTPTGGSRQGTPSRRPSTTDSSGRRSPAGNVMNPGGLHLLLSAINPDSVNRDRDSTFEIDLYDTCPTPYHDMIKGVIPTLEEESNLMRIEFLTATVNSRNVKQQMDELITGPDDLYVKGGLKEILGVCPDSDEEIFNATFIYRSEFQLHRKCDKSKSFYLKAPEGLQLRIVCVSYHGHDYVASANALLKENNTILDIPCGKLEEMLKCPIPAGGYSLEIPFLFTFVLESSILHKKCGIYEDFFISKLTPTLASMDKRRIGGEGEEEIQKQENLELQLEERCGTKT